MARISFDAMVIKMTAKVNCVEPGEIRVEAPPFHVWFSGIHELVCFDKRDAVARMQDGFTVCEDPECDWCHDTELGVST